MTTPLRSADAEIQTVVAFRTRHRAVIERAFRRARSDSDVELSPAVFSLRLFEACELVFAVSDTPRSQIGRFIDCLHVADLYLATAAAEGDAEAQSLLRRWYAPILARRAGPGAEALEAVLLAATGPSAPLAHYYGLCPLAGWIGAAAASAMPSAPPPSGLRELSFAGPDLRRNLDVTAGRVLSGKSPEARFGLALIEVSGADPSVVGDSLSFGAPGLRRLHRRVISEVSAAVDTVLAATGANRASRREVWLRIAKLASSGEKLTTTRGRPRHQAIAGVMVRASLRRATTAHTATACPERNRLLATLEPALRLDLDQVLEHASMCWPCLESVTAALRSAPPPVLVRHTRRNCLIGVAAVGAIAAGLSAWDLPASWTQPEPPPEIHAVANPGASALTMVEPPAPEHDVIAQLPDLRNRDRVVATTEPAEPLVSPRSSPTPNPSQVRASTTPASLAAPNRLTLATPTPAIDPPPSPPLPTPPPQASPSVASTPAASPPTVRADMPRPALRTASGNASAARLVNLAVSRYREGEERRAIDLLKRALEMDPELTAAHLDCATLFDRLGERDRAMPHWRRFLVLAPSDGDAEFARQRVAER